MTALTDLLRKKVLDMEIERVKEIKAKRAAIKARRAEAIRSDLNFLFNESDGRNREKFPGL